MKAETLVSVVTPCLNPGHRLARCLDSVAAQTYPRIEHLVVDGGSTDGTLELLKTRGIRFISEPDRGQTDAINKGFALARGEWLGWLNADDVLAPRGIELAMAFASETPGCGWIYGDNEMWWNGELQQRRVTPPAHLHSRMLEQGNVVPQAGSLIARWALERVGPLDDELHLAMDYDLWLRLAEANVPSVYVPETLAAFELHDTSKSGTIPHSEFLFEWAVSLLRRGRRRSAILMFGWAAAAAAQPHGQRIERQRLEQEIGRVAERAREYAADLDLRSLRAAACAHAALRELHLRPRGFQHLLRPEPWLVRETRARLTAVLARGFFRRLVPR